MTWIKTIVVAAACLAITGGCSETQYATKRAAPVTVPEIEYRPIGEQFTEPVEPAEIPESGSCDDLKGVALELAGNLRACNLQLEGAAEASGRGDTVD